MTQGQPDDSGKLEPCPNPFPYPKGHHVSVMPDGEDGKVWRVQCSCGIKTHFFLTTEEAAGFWNATLRRPTPSADADRVRAETPWDKGKQALALAALEWERLRRGMPGSTPETIKGAEAAFWCEAGKLRDLKIKMLTDAIQAARAASPDGKTSWDRVEDYRIEHGHLPRQDGKKEPTCKACMESQA